jgi:hypothetical protein
VVHKQKSEDLRIANHQIFSVISTCFRNRFKQIQNDLRGHMNKPHLEKYLPQLLTSEDMAVIDENAASLGIPRHVLMENAGAEVARITDEQFRVKGKKVIIFGGIGNNGGDGFVVTRHLLNRGASVSIILLGQAVERRIGGFPVRLPHSEVANSQKRDGQTGRNRERGQVQGHNSDGNLTGRSNPLPSIALWYHGRSFHGVLPETG